MEKSFLWVKDTLKNEIMNGGPVSGRGMDVPGEKGFE